MGHPTGRREGAVHIHSVWGFLRQVELRDQRHEVEAEGCAPPLPVPIPQRITASGEYAAFITKPGDTNVPGREEGTVTAPQTQDKVQTQTNLIVGGSRPRTPRLQGSLASSPIGSMYIGGKIGGQDLLGSALRRGQSTDLSGRSQGQSLQVSIFLCFSLPPWLRPDSASAGGGEGTGGLPAFGTIWGLCLWEMLHCTPGS